jgi:hypothetical protein
MRYRLIDQAKEEFPVTTAAVAGMAPALDVAAVATERVSRESVVLPLHLAHFGEAAAAGTVSFRTLGSVLNGFREVLGSIAGAIGISVTTLVGLGVAGHCRI